MRLLLVASLGAGCSFRQRLTFDNRGRGTLANFPVLVVLEAFGETEGSGIAFFDVDDPPLPHQIDEWDPTGRSLVWVRVPELSGDEVVPGALGRARALNGMNEVIDLGRDLPLLVGVSGMTLEAWARPATITSADDRNLVAVSIDGTVNSSRAQIKLGAAGEMGSVFRAEDAAEPSAALVSAQVVASESWVWLVSVADLTEDVVWLYANGVEIGSLPNAGLADLTPDTAPDLARIGSDENGGEVYG